LGKSGDEYVGSLRKQATQTMIATAKTIAYNAALSLGVSAVVGLVTWIGKKLYDALTVSAEEMENCAAAAQKMSDSIDQNKAWISEITELREKLSDTTLSLSEQREAKENLLEIQDAIIKKYGDEAAAVDLVNGSYQEMIDMLDKVNKKEFNNWQSTNRKEIEEAIDKYGTSDKYAKFINGYSYQYGTFLNRAKKEDADKLRSIFKLVDSNPYDDYDDQRILQVNPGKNLGELKDSLSDLYAIIQSYNSSGMYNGLLDIIGEISSDVTNDAADYEETYLHYMKNIVLVNDTLSDSYQQTQKSVSEFYQEVASGNPEEVAQAYGQLQNDVSQFIETIKTNAGENSEEIAEYYKNTFNDILAKAKGESVKVDLKADTSNLKTEVKSVLEGLANLGYDDAIEIKGSLGSLSKHSEAYKVLNRLAGDLDTTMAGVIDKLEEYGYFGETSIPEVNDEIDKAVQSYQNIIATLTAVREEQDATGQISTATMMKLTALGEDYAELIKTETNALGELVYVFDTDAAEKFALDQLQIATNAVIAADGTEEQIDALNSYYRSMQPLTSQMEGYIATVKDLDEIQKEVAKGTQYTEEEINELLKKYPQLTAVVDESTGKYKITETSIESLKGKFTSLIQTIIDVKTEMAKLMAVFAAKEARDGWAGAEQWVKLIQKKIKETGAKTIEELEKELGVTFADDLRGTVQVLVDTTPAVDSYEDVISGEKDAADFIYNPTTDKSDPWKEAFEKEYQAKKHALAMEQIDQKAYLDWLDGAYKKYFSDMSKYQDEYYQYEEEVFNGRRALIDEHISDLEKEYEYLGDEPKVIEELNRLLEEKNDLLSEEQRNTISSKILQYQEDGYRKQIAAIEDQIDLLDEKEGTEEQTIECYKQMINLLSNIKSIYAGIYDENSELMISLNREIADMFSEINDIKKEIWEAQRDAQVEALEEEQDAIEDYQDAIEDILDATVDLIKRETEAEIEALEEARDAREEYYDAELDQIKEVADARKEALEDELEGYRKIIEAKKEALRNEAEEEDYNDEVAKRSKEISDLQSRIDVLKLDDSKAAAAERLQLESELQTKKDELAKYQRDHSLDKQIEALDKELEAFEENNDSRIELIDKEQEREEQRIEELKKKDLQAYDDRIAALRAYLEKEGVLWREANRRIREEGDSLWLELRAYAEEYTRDVESLEQAWEFALTGVQKYNDGIRDLLATSNKMDNIFNRNESTIKDLENSEYTGEFTVSQKNSIAEIRAQMKANSAAWWDAHNAGDEAAKNWWSDENQRLKDKLNDILGGEYLVYNAKKGTWSFNGVPFYDMPIYHKGGVVGDFGSMQQDELLAVLKNREMVLTEPMQDTLAKYIDFAKNASFAITSILSDDPVKNIVAGLKSGRTFAGDTLSTIHVDKLFEFHADNVTKETLPDLKKTLRETADYTIRQMEDRLSRRGVKTKAKTTL